MSEFIDQCSVGVHPVTVAAVIQQESGGDPLALEAVVKQEDKGRLPQLTLPANKTLHEAVSKANILQSKGYSISIGLMQVNDRHYQRFDVTVEDMFDPCTNVKYGSTILAENYKIASAEFSKPEEIMISALSAYNTGKFKGSNTGYQYAQGVIAAAGGKKTANKKQSKAEIKALELQKRMNTVRSAGSRVNEFCAGDKCTKQREWRE